VPAADRYGARWDGSGTEVRVHARGPERIELCGLDDDGREWRTDLVRDGEAGWWSARTERLGPGDRYGFRLQGLRHNPNRLLLDPAARAVAGAIDWAAARFDDADWDSGPAVPWSVVVDPSFDWSGDRRPQVPAGQTVVYEANVRSLTARHPAVPAEHRGTYLGLAHPAVVDHLLDLGVTTVELLPLHHFVDSRALWSRALRNLWGYDPVAWFAPHAGYATSDRGQQVPRLGRRRLVPPPRRRRLRGHDRLPPLGRPAAGGEPCARPGRAALLGRRAARRRLPLRPGDDAPAGR
jgi:glycogen operon protein